MLGFHNVAGVGRTDGLAVLRGFSYKKTMGVSPERK